MSSKAFEWSSISTGDDWDKLVLASGALLVDGENIKEILAAKKP